MLLTDRVRAARQEATRSGGSSVAAARQARLLAEVGRRVAEPVEALPPGPCAPIQLSLYADAAYFALLASGVSAEPGATLENLWLAAPADRLLKAAGDEGTLARVKTALVHRPSGGDLAVEESVAVSARKFVEALIWELDAPERRLEHLLVQRWMRITVAIVLLAAAALGIRALALGPNLVENRPFRTSSTLDQCAHKGMCAELMFHTNQQDNPWVEFDLGAVRKIHKLEITNRSDCCAERAAGLIVEVGVDQNTWTEVAKNDLPFLKWSPSFAKRSARYVRLRVPRNTTLHLDDVVVR